MRLLLGISASMALLLGSTASLLAHAPPTSISIKPNALTGRHDMGCNTPQCGEACVIVCSQPDCDFLENPVGARVIEDTAGSRLPFNASWIKSLWYFAPAKNAIDCPYIQFSFFDSSNQSVGWTYIAPGQNYSPCVKFDSAAVSYSAVTMLVGVPEHLLEQEANGHGNLEG